MSAVDPRGDEHRAWDELAVGWTLHALEPEDEALFAAHLTDCPRCTRTVAETAEVMAAMARDLPQAEPSDGLRDRLRAAVEETEQLPPARPAESRRIAPQPAVSQPSPAVARDHSARGNTARDVGGLADPVFAEPADLRPAWRRLLPTALAAAAVAAVLALGAWNVVLSSDLDSARSTAAERSQVLEALLVPGQATIAPLTDDGDPVATVVVRDGQAQVVTTGLPVNDRSDSTYVLWGMGAGSPVAIGTFDVVTPQMDLRTVGSAATGLDQYSAYAVSIEPGQQAPSEPTDVVANGQVTS
ncbi:anti-sigma factor domain-containing protein [Modestobacter italicus]|uniref:anti-sigma factor n=1 Tax=Modestobacter italicus (strain DSM 44449 / CECT 9708 / BC 501) TaxID=2732864 RepID=UPI001C9605FA|nr:anti-sigma factor [Modestobacter italicus]